MTRLAAISLLALAACGSSDANLYMAFSEDGSKIATVLTDETCVTCNIPILDVKVGEVRDLGDGTAKMVKSELIIEVHEEPPPAMLTPLSMFFMEAEDYILISLGHPSGGTEIVVYEATTGISTELAVQEPVDDDVYLEAIPSPDGKRVALVQRDASDKNTAQITMLAAGGFAELWTQSVPLTEPSWRAKWNTDETFIVGIPGGKSYGVSAAEVAEVSEPACWFPRTSSSSSFSGMRILDNAYADSLDGSEPSAGWADCD